MKHDLHQPQTNRVSAIGHCESAYRPEGSIKHDEWRQDRIASITDEEPGVFAKPVPTHQADSRLPTFGYTKRILAAPPVCIDTFDASKPLNDIQITEQDQATIQHMIATLLHARDSTQVSNGEYLALISTCLLASYQLGQGQLTATEGW